MDVYSRIMISNKSGKHFVKNKIGLAERWITTTDPNETFVYNFYKQLKMRDSPPFDIIKWLCEGEYKHDEKLQEAIKKAGREMPKM